MTVTIDPRAELLERTAKALKARAASLEGTGSDSSEDPVLNMVHQHSTTLADLYRKARRAGLTTSSTGNYH